jgi:Sodium/hydrogen exchanger family
MVVIFSNVLLKTLITRVWKAGVGPQWIATSYNKLLFSSMYICCNHYSFSFHQLLLREWPNVLSLLGGLIAIKTLIITALGPRVGLSLQESIRIGLLLSQGGEFGFVVFSLANRLVRI